MSLKSLVVHLDSPEQSKARLAAALDIAERHKAHIVGLYIRTEPVLPAFAMGQMPAEVLQNQEAQLQERCDDALEYFKAEAEKRGVAYEARSDRAFAEEMPEKIALHARYADLLILGQDNPDDPGFGGPSMIDRTVLMTGGPCLIVPYIGAPENFGKKIAVAWDAGREAARAVKDAMGWMAAAEEVTVLSIDPKEDTSGESHEPGQDAAHYLARHDIQVTASHVVTDGKITPAEMLLSWVSDSGCDMVVMGAYGHARLREIVMGGATRTLLRHMTVPVLMSH